MVGPLKIKSLSGESVRASEVCLCPGIMSNIAGSIIYQRRRLQQCHIHREQLVPGRDRSGRRALKKLEALQRSTQELRFGHKASRKRIFHGRERGDTLQEPSAMNHGHPQGQELQKRQKYCTWT